MYVYGENRLRAPRSGGNHTLVSMAGHQAVGVGVSDRTLDRRFVSTVAQQFRHVFFSPDMAPKVRRPPTLSRATPRRSSSGTVGKPGIESKLRGPSSAGTRRSMSA